MKRNIFIAIGILVILLGGGLFYWYEIRPSQIIKKCHALVEDQLNDRRFASQRREYLETGFSPVYERCLKENGLNQ